MAGKKHNYQVFIRHEPSEQMPDGVVMTQSFANPDTAIGWARKAHEWAGAAVARVTRKSDGVVIYDLAQGIELDYQEW